MDLQTSARVAHSQADGRRSEEHTSDLQSLRHLVCRLLLEKKKLNPIFVAYALGGFHNDLFMLVASTAAIALFLKRHDRTASTKAIVAWAIKIMELLILPFM